MFDPIFEMDLLSGISFWIFDTLWWSQGAWILQNEEKIYLKSKRNSKKNTVVLMLLRCCMKWPLPFCECTTAPECMLFKEGHAAAHEQLPASESHTGLCLQKPSKLF